MIIESPPTEKIALILDVHIPTRNFIYTLQRSISIFCACITFHRLLLSIENGVYPAPLQRTGYVFIAHSSLATIPCYLTCTTYVLVMRLILRFLRIAFTRSCSKVLPTFKALGFINDRKWGQYTNGSPRELFPHLHVPNSSSKSL